jgi:hypothetical protein
MNAKILLIIISLTLFSYSQAQENPILVKSGIDTGSDTPYGWKAAGDTSMAQWHEHKITQNRSLLINDTNESAYCEWHYELGRIPEQAAAAGKLFVSWDQRYNIISGEMRMTALFYNSSGGIIAQKHWLIEGISEGYDSEKWQNKEVELAVPPNAVNLKLCMVSGGPASTIGKFYLDNLIIRAPAGTIPLKLSQTGEYRLRLIENWDMEKTDSWRPDCPSGWQYDGPIPYLAGWCRNEAASGKRSICIIDDDPRSNALWTTYRHPLEYPPSELELSFAIKTKDIKGEWKIMIAYYDVGVEHNYSPLAMRVEGIIKTDKDSLTIDWLQAADPQIKPTGMGVATESSGYTGAKIKHISSTSLKYSDKDKNGFWRVSALIPAYYDTRAYRIALISGWSPESTGIVWLDDVSLSAVLPLEKEAEQ